ncbi:MAG: cupredoxin domain-containing protein [Candidatus Sericytochromatia bacterium]|nr:cupredoxin domain-containing protein [Candidatus Tanganyikabacteria bacterium]
MRKPGLVLSSLAALLALPGGIGCLRGPAQPTPAPVAAQGAVVDIKDFAFPTATTVKKGQAVAFRNLDPAVHNVAPQGGPAFDKSPDLRQGESHALTFKEAGTYEYRCEYHANMKGTITVEE